jgi:HD-like signal output (HDOD) protein
MIAANWTEWVTSDAWRAGDLQVIPVPPRALEEVFWLANQVDVETHRLIELVSKDPVLSIRVLRLANVAAFSPSREVTTVQTAVVRLGTRAVRNAVLAACFTSWIHTSNVYGRRAGDEVQHAIGAACLGRRVATIVGQSPDESFVHGLLHDIGKLFILKLRAEYVRLGGRRPSAEEIEAVIATHHAEMGGTALLLWGLPASVREPVRWHHDPLGAPEAPEATAITYTADRLCHRYGFGCAPDEDSQALHEDPVCVALGIDAKRLAQLDREALTLLVAAKQLVG